jgi:predicted metal-dependent hydrolase
MSDITNEVTPDVDPVVDGQVEVESGEATWGEEDFFPVDEYGDKVVKLNVSGEEVVVPLKEAVAGYQRQADYTRKTQELADQRKSLQFAQAIQQALDNNPTETISLLQQHYGLNAQQDPYAMEEDDLFADPMEQQYKQLDQRIRAFEEQQAMAELERTVSTLQSKYGEDFDANEVVSQALVMGSTDLEAVYKQIHFDRLLAKTQAQNAISSQQAQEDAKVLEAKRQAAIVSGGSSAQGTSTGAAPITSLRDAFAAAKQQLGIS